MNNLRLFVRIRPNTIPAQPIVTLVTVSPVSVSLTVGGTQQLTASAFASDGTAITGRTEVWTSSNAAAVSVSGTGLVSYVGVGDASITVSIDGVMAASPVLAHAATDPVALVTLDKTTDSVVVGQTSLLKATPRAADTTALPGRVVTWNSSDPTKATVSADDATNDPVHQTTMSGVAQGTTNVRATCEGIQSAVCLLTVTPTVVTSVVTTVTLDRTSAAGAIGQFVDIVATVKDQFGAVMGGQTVDWLSSTPATASVTTPGQSTRATYLANGTTNVTASVGAVTSSACAITVSAAVPSSVTLNSNTINNVAGIQTTLIATVRDAAGNIISAATTWLSSNPTVATASTPGSTSNIDLRTVGTTNITATAGSITSAPCVVTVAAANTTIPAGYDPARLGSELIQGNTWSAVVLGSDQGRTWLKSSVPGTSFGNGSSGLPITDAMWKVQPDELGLFPYVMWNNFVSGAQATVTRKVDPIPQLTHFWTRQVFRFYSPNTYGTGVGGLNSNGVPGLGDHYPTWFSTKKELTEIDNESSTLKFMFGWWTNRKGRMEQVWVASNQYALGSGHLWNKGTNAAPAYDEHNFTETELIQAHPDATHPQSVAPGAFAGIYSSSKPGGQVARTGSTTVDPPNQGAGTRVLLSCPADVIPASGSGSIAAHNCFGTGHIPGLPGHGDWYECIMNYELLSGSINVLGGSYIQRHFFRRLTVAGVYNPWPCPVWWGKIYTNALPYGYNGFWHTGNRSGKWPTNTSGSAWAGDQADIEGPWEITTAADPYGWDSYGK